MNKTTIICLLGAFLLPSCAVQMICPAYQSAFVLDETEQREMYALFTVYEGDTVPKRPYGFRFKSDGDSLTGKFIKGTKGAGFRVQAGRVHSFEKSGFTYENRMKEKLWARVFQGKEKPVLENPYLFDRITKKKPFYKLDQLELELVHFNRTRYDSLVRQIVNARDTSRYDLLMAEMAQFPSAIQAQFSPLLRPSFNQEQEEYNKKFGDYFLRLAPEAKIDSTELALAGDTAVSDSTAKKKGIFGLFKKGKKKKKGGDGTAVEATKSKKEKRRDRKKNKKNNEEGIKEEEDNNN